MMHEDEHDSVLHRDERDVGPHVDAAAGDEGIDDPDATAFEPPPTDIDDPGPTGVFLRRASR